MRTRIVAEISKNWPEVEPGLLSQRFEGVIATNEERGYVLESWQLVSSSAPTRNSMGQDVTRHVETIIAVFVRKML